MPGTAAGSGGAAASLGYDDTQSLRPLTVNFHETGFRARLAGENAQGFWFQMSGRQRHQATPPWGPGNPQELNRYSYVNNNPLRYADPSGHDIYLDHADAETAVDFLTLLVTTEGLYAAVVAAVVAEGVPAVVELLKRYPAAAHIGKFLGTSVGAVFLGLIVSLFVIGEVGAIAFFANLAWAINKNNGPQGVGITFVDGWFSDDMVVMNSATGAQTWVEMANYWDWVGGVPDSFKSGVVVRNPGLQVTCRFFRGAGDGSSICHAAPVDPANPPVIPFPK